mmetsp:Transcript_91037/g.257190  ORF Transcript_91037/g.257190 Transcript_91037/m.257190 type:complete len:302 (-) Transcript_91037:1597-2502(-)
MEVCPHLNGTRSQACYFDRGRVAARAHFGRVCDRMPGEPRVQPNPITGGAILPFCGASGAAWNRFRMAHRLGRFARVYRVGIRCRKPPMQPRPIARRAARLARDAPTTARDKLERRGGRQNFVNLRLLPIAVGLLWQHNIALCRRRGRRGRPNRRCHWRCTGRRRRRRRVVGAFLFDMACRDGAGLLRGFFTCRDPPRCRGRRSGNPSAGTFIARWRHFGLWRCSAVRRHRRRRSGHRGTALGALFCGTRRSRTGRVFWRGTRSGFRWRCDARVGVGGRGCLSVGLLRGNGCARRGIDDGL